MRSYKEEKQEMKKENKVWALLLAEAVRLQILPTRVCEKMSGGGEVVVLDENIKA